MSHPLMAVIQTLEGHMDTLHRGAKDDPILRDELVEPYIRAINILHDAVKEEIARKEVTTV